MSPEPPSSKRETQKIQKKGECSSNSQPTLEVTIARKAKYPAKSCQAKEINKAVTYFIAKDAIPVSTVSKPGFKHLVSKLNPKYEIPTRKHFSEIEIPALYSLVRANTVKPLVSKVECYAATTDLWTSGSCDPYITVTLHFIDYEWNLKSFCLDTVPMYDDHTGQNISDALLDVLENWELSKTKWLQLPLNGANVVAALRNLGVRISCFGHNLDLAIKKALIVPHVKQALARCHALVELFHRSWKKKSRFKGEAGRIRPKATQAYG